MRKKKLQDLHARLKEWCDSYGDAELEQIVTDFDDELTNDDDTGGSNPPNNKERPDKP